MSGVLRIVVADDRLRAFDLALLLNAVASAGRTVFGLLSFLLEDFVK